jgi:hypothetical protein
MAHGVMRRDAAIQSLSERSGHSQNLIKRRVPLARGRVFEKHGVAPKNWATS